MGRNGLYNLKTALKAKVRARPKVKGSEYLDLFIKEKTKARIEQEKTAIERKTRQVKEDLRELQEEIETIEKSLSMRGKKTEKRPPKKQVKTMTIDY